MKEIVKWNDVKRIGISRRLWRCICQRMKPVLPRGKLYRAEDVAKHLNLAPEVFAYRMQQQQKGARA